MTTPDADPGPTGSLVQRIAEVVENEVPAAYADLVTRRLKEAVDVWQSEATEAAEVEALQMFGGLMPGNTGANMANEVAARIVAALRITEAGQ